MIWKPANSASSGVICSSWLALPSLLRIPVIGLLVLLGASPCFSDKASSVVPSIVVDLPNPETDVLTVVRAVADDHIIRGTYVYEREKTLGDAAAESTSSFFGSWKGDGHVFYKVRRAALAPRNFKDSSDIGVITVRYVVHATSDATTHLEITAVFIEDGTHRVHLSDSTVESNEFSEIQRQLTDVLKDRQRAAETEQKKVQAAEQEKFIERQRNDEIGRYQDTESSLKTLERRADELEHALEVRVPGPNTELKSAPFRGAATLTKVPANSDVLVEIVTTYWYGVELADGHRGWVRRDQVVPLP
jgi:hypothetical protein